MVIKNHEAHTNLKLNEFHRLQHTAVAPGKSRN